MRGTMIILAPDTSVPVVVELDRELKEGELHTAVGGYIELVPYFDSIGYCGVVMDCAAFCNEDGKREQLPFNSAATAAWMDATRRCGARLPSEAMLLGPVVILFGDREFMEAL